MSHFQNINSPIVVGGVGGSGTRVIAQMLMTADVYMGDMLNEPNDNLWFTLLFRRPNLLKTKSEEEQLQLLEIFRKRMLNEKTSFSEKMKVQFATYEFISNRYIKSKEWFSLPMKISKSIRTLTVTPNKKYWGWKEPNTHFYIPLLAKKFPDMKYLLVIRNGFDMAFSSNHVQLRNFGSHYGISGYSPADMLQYWILANNKAIERGEKFFGGNFKVLHLENLCANAKEETKNLLEWAEIKFDNELLKKLSAIPQLPESTNRFHEKDLSIFTSHQLKAVQQLGYTTEK